MKSGEMNINPQFTYDNQGNPVGVFLSMEDWKKVTRDIAIDVPEWEKKLIDRRLNELNMSTEELLNWPDVLTEFDKEDGAI